MKITPLVASTLVIALASLPVAMARGAQAGPITLTGTAKKEAKRPYPNFSVRARAVGDGSVAASVPLDGAGGFSIPDLKPSSYLLELVNHDGKVVCTEGPVAFAKSTDKISIRCGRDRTPLLLLLAAAGAAGITAGIVTSGDASPSR
jgi:hypothetical protein